MSRIFMRFPDFKPKAVTLSYDDGVRQDKRLIAIMKKYGLKGTFNINGGLLSKNFNGEITGRMTKEEILALYEPSNMEVAIHGYNHLPLPSIESAMRINEIMCDRKVLENMFGHIIQGMAYAYGTFDDGTIDILKQCGVKYSRTITATGTFDLPDDWLRWNTTCHHNNPQLMEFAKRFVECTPDTDHFLRYRPKIFYLWGHSYEFDNNNNWKVIEEFASYIGKKDDIWYATNGEIYNYVQAYDRLEWGADSSYVFNPSALNVYINYFGKEYLIRSGQILQLS